jgi:hypothetical protein
MMPVVNVKRPGTRWLSACLAGLVLSSLVGGFSVQIAVVFVAIAVTGIALISRDTT